MTESKIKISATDKTGRAFNSINSNVKRMTGNLLSAKGAFTGFIGVAGVSKLASMTQEAISFADTIAKTSDKLGISTNALQEYRFAAELSGVAQTALDVGLQRWTRRLGEAAEGGGVLNQVLKDNNIAIRNSDGSLRSAESVLADYADTIQGAGSDQEKLLLAFKAFDTEGAAMVNMLQDGAAGLGALRAQAQAAGAVMDSELVRKAEVMNDKWSVLTDTIGVKFKSALISVADVFVDTATKAEKMDVITEKIKQIQMEMSTAAARGRTEFGGEIQLMKELGAEYAALSASKAAALDSTGNNSKALEEKAAEIERNAQLDATATAFVVLNEQNRQEEIVALREEEANRLRYISSLAMLEEMQYQEQITEDAKAKAEQRVQAVQSTFGALSSLTSSSSKRLFKMGKAASIASATMSTYAAVVESFKNAGGYPWGIAPAAAMAAAGAVQIQNIRSQKFSGAKEFGGPVINDRSYLVGERGPEIFTPNASGNITPNNKLASSTRTKNVNVTFTLPSDEYGQDMLRNNRSLIFNLMTEAMNEEGVNFA